MRRRALPQRAAIRPGGPAPGPPAQVSLRPSVRLKTSRSGRRVGVGAEVAEALELHGLADRQLGERGLDEAAVEHRLRVGVEVGERGRRRRRDRARVKRRS